MAQRYQFKNTCPRCGCSAVSNLTKKEIMERFGDVPNVDLECSECMATYQAKMKNVCPEWDKECRMKE
jgi:transcription elongation factor Elf1